MPIQTLKNIYHLFQAVYANLRFDFPSRRLYVIGVTGTNGKTTVTNLIGQVLEQAGFKVALASTINFWLDGKKWTNKTKFTTESAFKFQQFLARAAKAGCQFAVIETSSHALDQHRVWGTDYDLAVITNVTREHLDYHQTMPQYRRDKLRLFQMVQKKNDQYAVSCCEKKITPIFKNGFPAGFSVVNLGMRRPSQFMLGLRQKIIGFQLAGQQKKDSAATLPAEQIVEADQIRLSDSGSSFVVKHAEKDRAAAFTLQLPGRFNIENALAAIAIARILKIKDKVTRQALAAVKKIPGRLDYVKNQQGINIVIDYALTPDSMKKVGRMFRAQLQRQAGKSDRPPKFIWVFGACGERDRGKRPIMGRIAARLADVVIVTNEDPYHEDPQRIMDEIFKGVVGKGKPPKTKGQDAFQIMDRRQAIKKALTLAKAGDIVLITGKGAEENMKIGDKLIDWNDRRVVEELLEET